MGMKKKLVLSVMGAAVLMSSFSNALADTLDEVISYAQQHSDSTFYDELCSIYGDDWMAREYCFSEYGIEWDYYGDDDGYDGYGDGSGDTSDEPAVTDEVVVTAVIQRRFELVVYLLAQVRAHFPKFLAEVMRTARICVPQIHQMRYHSIN